MNKRPLALPVLIVGTLAATLLAATPPNLPRALDAQRELVRTHATDARALNDLGNLLLLAGDASGAESAYRRAVDAAPDLISPRFNLGLLLLQGRDRDGALEQFDTILTAYPDHAWSHYQTGVIFEEQGRDRDAVSAYARAFALDPGLSFADVNPQVLDSHLIERALLEVSNQMVTVAQAPRRYEDPSRIAGLLLPTSEPSEKAMPAAEGSPAETETTVETSGRVSPVPRSAPDGDDSVEDPIQRENDPPPNTRVLDQSSLTSSGGVGGAVGVGAGARGSGRSIPTETSEAGRSTTTTRADSVRTRPPRPTYPRGDSSRTGSSSSRPSSRSTGQNGSRIDG